MTESTHLHTQEPSSSQNTKSIFNLPNNLTIARILMIPLFVAIAYWPPAMGIGMPAISDNVIARVGMSEFSDSLLRHLLLTSVFVIAAITDWLDGYFARKLNVMSAFGRFLDPVADKLMVGIPLLFALYIGQLIIIIGRCQLDYFGTPRL